MDQIEFADGFDRPDTLAFGLGAGQLAVVMVGALAAYSLLRSPLPPAVVDPVAVAIAAAAAGSDGCALRASALRTGGVRGLFGCGGVAGRPMGACDCDGLRRIL